MTPKMRAAVVEQFEKPLVVQKWDIPPPSHGTQSVCRRLDDSKLAHAKRLGADPVFNVWTGDPAEALKKETGGGAHGVLITAPSLPAFKQGVGMTRKLGTCVLVGLLPGKFPLPLFNVVADCITIRGSFVGTCEVMAEALSFAAKGKVKADIEMQPLTSINHELERLEHGDVAACVVLDFEGAASHGLRPASTNETSKKSAFDAAYA